MQNVIPMTAPGIFVEIVLSLAARVAAAKSESCLRTVDTKYSQSGASADRMLGSAMVIARGYHAGHRISSAKRRK
jgi:hypothetical protein